MTTNTAPTHGPYEAQVPPSSEPATRRIYALREDGPDIAIADIGMPRTSKASIFEEVANADFIALAMNSYHPLREALVLAWDMLPARSPADPEMSKYDTIRAALAGSALRAARAEPNLSEALNAARALHRTEPCAENLAIHARFVAALVALEIAAIPAPTKNLFAVRHHHKHGDSIQLVHSAAEELTEEDVVGLFDFEPELDEYIEISRIEPADIHDFS